MIHEILKEDWQEFLSAFSKLHSNWLVDVESNNANLSQVPLQEITVVGSDICLKVGESKIKIQEPFRIRLQQTKEGADVALEIESAHEAYRVLFRAPILPELVDGVP